jgi:hypothetical protein
MSFQVAERWFDYERPRSVEGDVTKAEAVAYLTSREFHAFERDWAMGETIGVAAGPTEHGGITVYRYIVYLPVIRMTPIRTLVSC